MASKVLHVKKKIKITITVMYGEGRTFGTKKELSSGGNKEMVKVDSIKCQLLRLGG